MTGFRHGVVLAALLLSACGQRALEPDAAIVCDQCDSWNQPQNPFRVHGNTWYVGTDGLSSILIESDDGLILIDGGLPQSAALIDENIRDLGFDTRDIKAILVSHVHYDHAGGISALQRLSGANVFTSIAGSGPLAMGVLADDDPQYIAGSNEGHFPPVREVVAVEDGGVVTVGTLDVKAVYTPGHTPGAGIIADLDCDILLVPHPFFFGMDAKLERRDQGNPFVNNLGCVLYAESSLDWLERRLEAERSH